MERKPFLPTATAPHFSATFTYCLGWSIDASEKWTTLSPIHKFANSNFHSSHSMVCVWGERGGEQEVLGSWPQLKVKIIELSVGLELTETEPKLQKKDKLDL